MGHRVCPARQSDVTIVRAFVGRVEWGQRGQYAQQVWSVIKFTKHLPYEHSIDHLDNNCDQFLSHASLLCSCILGKQLHMNRRDSSEKEPAKKDHSFVV